MVPGSPSRRSMTWLRKVEKAVAERRLSLAFPFCGCSTGAATAATTSRRGHRDGRLCPGPASQPRQHGCAIFASPLGHDGIDDLKLASPAYPDPCPGLAAGGWSPLTQPWNSGVLLPQSLGQPPPPTSVARRFPHRCWVSCDAAREHQVSPGEQQGTYTSLMHQFPSRSRPS